MIKADNTQENNKVQDTQRTYRWWLVYSVMFILIYGLFMISFWTGWFDVEENGIKGEFIAAVAITVGVFFTWLLSLFTYSRVAFLLATIFSLNPVIWVINGIYLKNRWSAILRNK